MCVRESVSNGRWAQCDRRTELTRFLRVYYEFSIIATEHDERADVSALVCHCTSMGRLRLEGAIKLHNSFVIEPYKIDDILRKRPII